MALSTISGTTGITDATITSANLADFSAAVDLNGVELLLDADADTSISADTDDRIDFKIANPKAQIDLSTYAQQTIEQTDEYKTIFQMKPAMFSEEQYLAQYINPVSQVMSAGDPNYTSIVGASAALGGSPNAAGTAAFFGSPEVAMSDTYTKTVNSTAERLGKIL